MKRSVWLAYALPALSFAAGGSEIPFFGDRNIDMSTTLKATDVGGGQRWPESLHSIWHHSDFRAVAYYYTYPFYTNMVSTGGLK